MYIFLFLLLYYIIVSSLVLRLCLIVLSPVKASALDRNNQRTIVNKYCKIFSLNKVFEVEVKEVVLHVAGCSQGKKFQVFLENTWIAPCEGKNT